MKKTLLILPPLFLFGCEEEKAEPPSLPEDCVGVYLYQIQVGEFVQTRKMVLLK